MNRILSIIVLVLVGLTAYTQETTVDFEEFGLVPEEFRNGSDGTTDFSNTLVSLPINYDDTYSSWTGWALSAVTDNETPGFGNQYSAITGSGVDGSTTYATSYNFIPNSLTVKELSFPDAALTLRGIYITNATYAYLSMRDGDAFAKKFGGADGNDPDFFLLTIKGLNLEMAADSVEVYLADYRSDNNSEDYLLDTWMYVDLSKFSTAQDLTFHLSSSDVGQFGVNTPQYFCIDNIEFDLSSNTDEESLSHINVYPNPTTNFLNIDKDMPATYSIIDHKGQLVSATKLTDRQVNVDFLTPGVYSLIVNTQNGITTKRFVKK
jgi:hypothetical protein